MISIQEEVKNALQEGKAVVALESTIIAHGMPFPQNYETAKILEAQIREGGAVPATIALINGEIKIGLEEDELQFLATSKDIAKASQRDLAYILSRKLTAATTVASTMYCANLAGIRVFATGGIGGVHRGALESMDISADLQELAHTPVCVVSAGAKAILDLGLTLEYLETMGVPVIGYSCDDFPAFYSRQSGFKVPLRMDKVEDIAELIHYQSALGLSQGILIANPIPEAWSMPEKLIEGAIQQALNEADEKLINGKELTPFLLKRISELTDGKSLFSNIELVKNNVSLATSIALELTKKAEPPKGGS